MSARRVSVALIVGLALAPQAVAAQGTARTPDGRVVALARGIYRLTSLGDSAVLSARIFGEGFKPLAGVPIEWRSDDESIAAATPAGAVVAMRNGSTRVWARAGFDSVFAVITVEQRAAKLAWNVSNPLVFDAIGATAALRAEQRDARGAVVRGDFPLTACTLKDEGGTGATVLAAGRLTARANGAATLTCKRGTVKDDLKIVVRQSVFAARILGGDTLAFATAGDTTRLTVQAFDRNGKPIADARGQWASLAPDIVDVDPASGTILAKAQGIGLVTAKFDAALDTVVVNVLGPLPEGRVMPTLARARPAPVAVAAQPVASTPSGAGATLASGTGAAVTAPSAPVLPPSSSGRQSTTFLASRGQVATFASGGGSASSAAVDSAVIAKIIEAGVAAGGGDGRTLIITPMATQVEYRVLVDSVGVVYTTGGLVFGASGAMALTRSLFVDGHFLTGSLKATSGTITNLFDGEFADARADIGYEPLAGFVLRVGYGVRGVGRTAFNGKEAWAMVRTGLEGRFGLFGDRLQTKIGFTYFPSITATGHFTDSPSSSVGANGGLTYRAGWFTLGVDYAAQSVEFGKVTLGSSYQRQVRYSALSFTLGAHWGR